MFDTPVLFIIFNREDTAKIVFEKIREIKPKELYVAGDGARNESEKVLTDKARAIIKEVDWDCNVHTLFSDKNLGCRVGVSSAIDWFFDNVEMGIILEDDIVPDLSFFYFCETLLHYYKDNERVMHIAGEAPLNYQVGDASYYFATVQHCWGWASWRDAWKNYDITLESVSFANISEVLKKRYNDFNVRDYWKRWFFRTKKDKPNTWDFQWTYIIMSLDGVCINPNFNLISNIGFGENSTHTKNENDKNSNRLTHSIKNIVHPDKIELNKNADVDIALDRFDITRFNIKNNIVREIKRIIKQIKNLFSVFSK